MKLFWDVNVLLDLIDQDRDEHLVAKELFTLSSQRQFTHACAWHSLSILYYLCRPKFGKESSNELMRELLRVFQIPATGSLEARQAFEYLSTDFEDALQISAALSAQAELILSRDAKGLRKSPLPVLSPREFFEQSLG